MPRSYGRFTTSIFRDEDFRALTAEEQGVYFMLGLQPEVTAAGTLPLTLRRWSGMCADMNRDGLAETLSVLADRGHILVDWDTEELLIVKFVKWDGGIGNEKRRPVILESACAIQSERIRHSIAHEIELLGYTDMASRVRGEAASETPSPSDRVVVKEGDQIPQPLNRNPQPQSATPKGEPSGASAETPSLFCSKHPNGTEKPCGACGTAKLRYAAWLKSAAGRAASERAAREQCPDCRGGVWLDNGKKCTHPNSRRTA